MLSLRLPEMKTGFEHSCGASQSYCSATTVAARDSRVQENVWEGGGGAAAAADIGGLGG